MIDGKSKIASKYIFVIYFHFHNFHITETTIANDNFLRPESFETRQIYLCGP